MKKITMFFLQIVLVVLISSCQQSKDNSGQGAAPADSASQEEMAHVTYTCTMHPEVVSDKPGKCPKCGMELVEKESGHNHNEEEDSTEHQH